MDNFDEARDAYKALKYGQPSANDLVAAADIIKELLPEKDRRDPAAHVGGDAAGGVRQNARHLQRGGHP